MNYFIKYFGCQINNLDYIKLVYFLKNNFLLTNKFDFDILIFITCSIREFVHKKFFFFLKKIKKNILKIVCGCLSNLFFYFLIKKKNVDIIINSYSLFFFVFLINFYYFYNCKQLYFRDNFLERFINFKKSIYIIIMEGCNKYCYYCIIPYTKGREIYRNLYLIFKEVFFFNYFFLEILFLGQNINYYKFYLINNKIFGFYVFIFILNSSFSFFFYYLTLNPKNINFNLNFYKLFTNLHLPLQSASNCVLLFMNRKYSSIFYKKFFYFLKNFFLNFFLNSDFIICYSAELSYFFNITILYLEKIIFDKSYIFIYNLRSYTNSLFFFNNINIILKKKRFLKIFLKLNNNLKMIIKYLYNKFYFILIKYISLNFNLLFFSFLNNKIIFFFIYTFKIILKKILFFKILKFYKKFFFSIFY